jgi:hypothetical protein
LIGQDIFKLTKHFIVNFLSKKNMQSNNSRPSITYELFSKIVGKSCLIDVLRNTIFGCQPEVPNVFIIDEKITFEDEYMFDGVDVVEDVSYGQRGYLRNQEALMALMQKHLERYSKKKDNNVVKDKKKKAVTHDEPAAT